MQGSCDRCLRRECTTCDSDSTAPASQAHAELCARIGQNLTAYFPLSHESANVQSVAERIAAPFAFTGESRQAACTALESTRPDSSKL